MPERPDPGYGRLCRRSRWRRVRYRGTTAAGTGGVTSGGGGAGGGGGAPTTELIDDFEDTNLQVLVVAPRNGSWYPFHDPTVGGVQAFANTALSGANLRAGSSSTHALHMTATGFTNYGAGFGGDFVNIPVKTAYNVSAYKGIPCPFSLWKPEPSKKS